MTVSVGHVACFAPDAWAGAGADEERVPLALPISVPSGLDEGTSGAAIVDGSAPAGGGRALCIFSP